MDFRDFKLYKKLLVEYYDLCSLSLDTSDYVPEKTAKMIDKKLYKKFIVKFKQCDKEYKILLKKDKKKIIDKLKLNNAKVVAQQ